MAVIRRHAWRPASAPAAAEVRAGANRISASELAQIAKTLEVSVTCFFGELSREVMPGAPLDLAYDAEIDQLSRRIRRLDLARRRLVSDLVNTIKPEHAA